MASSIFRSRSDETYASLGVIPPGQRWFAFDVAMPQARRHEATKFVMTVWNYHRFEDSEKFSDWAIKHDRKTGSFWYPVVKKQEGKPPRNLTSLWEALHIAHVQGLPMQALLKDAATGRCAPDFVFRISDVLQAADGFALWLRLEISPGQVGTTAEEIELPPMVDLQTADPSATKRSGKLPPSQYMAACELAADVQSGKLERSQALRMLVTEHGLNASSASVLLNNYRCLATGSVFKAQMSVEAMQFFVDSVIARGESGALENVISALSGYVDYAVVTWDGKSSGMVKILDELRRESEQADDLKELLAATNLLPGAASGLTNNVASEIRREIWARGPQHAAFRRELVRRWSDRCSVHGASCNGQLRASHIVAWRLDEALRGEVSNGLLLTVPLDSLFDRGLISFSDEGVLLRSHKLENETVTHFGLKPGLRLSWDHLPESSKEAIRSNLARHRDLHIELQPYLE